MFVVTFAASRYNSIAAVSRMIVAWKTSSVMIMIIVMGSMTVGIATDMKKQINCHISIRAIYSAFITIATRITQ